MAKTIQTAIEAGSRMAPAKFYIKITPDGADAVHPRTNLIAMVPIITRTGTRKRRHLMSLYWKMPKNI